MNEFISIADSTTPLRSPGFLKFHRHFWKKALVHLSIILLSLDFIYKTIFGVTYQNRQDCILYDTLPRWAFLFYEYFIELMLIVVVGIFVAALIEKYFTKLGRFLPNNSFTAFLYASVLPVCSCSAIPIVKAVNHKIPFRVIITFIVAAPLLNPYIITISAAVLDWKYAILRIVCSFILAVVTGYVGEFFYVKMDNKKVGLLKSCSPNHCCLSKKSNIYDLTYVMFKKVFLFLIIAGALSVSLELISPEKFLNHWESNSNISGILLVILIGVPVYFCNGADVLFLKPLMQFANVPLGTAMAFSLTSTSVCITSLFLLAKYVGKKLTAIILATVVLITLLLGLIIQAIPM